MKIRETKRVTCSAKKWQFGVNLNNIRFRKMSDFSWRRYAFFAIPPIAEKVDGEQRKLNNILHIVSFKLILNFAYAVLPIYEIIPLKIRLLTVFFNWRNN